MDDLENQLSFWGKDGIDSGRSPSCLVSNFVEKNDSSCKNFEKSNYEVIECGTKKGIKYVNDCRGITFENVSAKTIKIKKLPRFVPAVSGGSGFMLKKSDIPWVAITLADAISPSQLTVTKNIREKIGVSNETKILLLNYAGDSLIEKIWTKRREILPQIAQLDIDLMTAIDYSVFWDQPHLERLVNMKRSLITFDIFQKYGAKVVPHIYWSSKKDIERWAKWLSHNPSVTSVSMYWGLFKDNKNWKIQIEYFKYFNKIIDRPIHQIISGPSTEEKIKEVASIAQNITITNGSAARLASGKKEITKNGIINVFPKVPFTENVEYFSKLSAKNKCISYPRPITEKAVIERSNKLTSLGKKIMVIDNDQKIELNDFLLQYAKPIENLNIKREDKTLS